MTSLFGEPYGDQCTSTLDKLGVLLPPMTFIAQIFVLGRSIEAEGIQNHSI